MCDLTCRTCTDRLPASCTSCPTGLTLSSSECVASPRDGVQQGPLATTGGGQAWDTLAGVVGGVLVVVALVCVAAGALVLWRRRQQQRRSGQPLQGASGGPPPQGPAVATDVSREPRGGPADGQSGDREADKAGSTLEAVCSDAPAHAPVVRTAGAASGAACTCRVVP